MAKRGQQQPDKEIVLKWADLTPEQQQAAKQVVFESIGYEPQGSALAVHLSQALVIVISGGEGGGKSVTTSAEIAGRYPAWERVLLVAYKAESATNEADYLYDFLKKIGAVKKYSKPKSGKIGLLARDGARVESVSTHAEGERAVSGTGKNYDLICMLEAGKQKYTVFLACLLRASRVGGTLILSGTIERSEPWFPSLIRKLKEDAARRAEMRAEVVIMPTWENRLLYPGGREDPKVLMLEKELGTDLFNERLGGEPSTPASLIFKEFSYLTHVFEWVRYDPSCPIQLAIDPGYSGSHYSVNFIQEHPRAYTRQFTDLLPDAPLTDVWVIGDLYLDHAVHEEVIKICQERAPYSEWWSRVQGGVGDTVMSTHPMADRAPIDVWREKGGILLRGQLIGVEDNIDRHKTFLMDPTTKMPRLFFSPTCQGIAEYGKWQRKEVGENIWGPPDKQNCDFTKALGYYLIDRFGRIEQAHAPHAVAGGQRVTLDQAERQLPQTMGVPQHAPLPTARPNNQYLVLPRVQKKPI